MTPILDVYSVWGWAGMILIIFNYILVSNRRLKTHYLLYHILNLLGAAGIFVSTFATQSWPAAVLSFIFAGISIAYIFKIIKIKPVYTELR